MTISYSETPDGERQHFRHSTEPNAACVPDKTDPLEEAKDPNTPLNNRSGSRCVIDKTTVPLKLIYFIFNGGMILVWPFIPNYLLSLGGR